MHGVTMKKWNELNCAHLPLWLA